jgi:hypothetical protein
MKSRGAIKYNYSANPIYVYWKKHYCPECGVRLTVKYSSKIVNSESSEAKGYDFSLGDTRLEGDVEFRKCYFWCEECKRKITFEEMKEIERRKKRRN